MISVYLTGGVGNQLFQYATGRRLADKLNTELELNLDFYDKYPYYSYVLPAFNLREHRITSENDSEVAKRIPQDRWVIEGNTQVFMPEVLNCPDNVCLRGAWECEKYFADIADDLRREFTLKISLDTAISITIPSSRKCRRCSRFCRSNIIANVSIGSSGNSQI